MRNEKLKKELKQDIKKFNKQLIIILKNNNKKIDEEYTIKNKKL